MAKDPVCGMEVDEASAKHMAEYHGQKYYFCAAGCTKAFEAEPQIYLDPNYNPSM
jgi:P-type Cu+ transporter